MFHSSRPLIPKHVHPPLSPDCTLCSALHCSGPLSCSMGSVQNYSYYYSYYTLQVYKSTSLQCQSTVLQSLVTTKLQVYTVYSTSIYGNYKSTVPVYSTSILGNCKSTSLQCRSTATTSLQCQSTVLPVTVATVYSVDATATTVKYFQLQSLQSTVKTLQPLQSTVLPVTVATVYSEDATAATVYSEDATATTVYSTSI